MRWKPIALGGGALLFLAAFVALVVSTGPLAPVRVEVVRAESGDLEPRVFGIGTVEARQLFAIGPVQSGRIERVLVDQGDRVRTGQVLVEMDPADLEQRLRAAESAVERAGEAERMAAALEREASARLELAAANAARYRELEERDFVSREAAEGRRAEADVAAAARTSARAAVAAAGHDAERARAERDALRRQRELLRLASPVDGVVVARDAEPGSTVVGGMSVLRVVDPAEVWVRARVDQGQAGGLAPGQPARIALRSRPEAPEPGTVARVDLQSDSVTEERIVHVAFARPPPRLHLGELAEVTVQLPATHGALTIPAAALRQLERRPGVWQVVGGRARFRQVEVGARTLDGVAQVLEGLAPGDEVVVHSATQLSEGRRVRVGTAPGGGAAR